MRNGTKAASAAALMAIPLLATVVTPPMAEATFSGTSSHGCAYLAPENGYVVVDPATNTSCTTNRNGTYLYLKGVKLKKNHKVTVVAGLCSITPRGDVRNYATVRYVRGKTVIRQRVALNGSCQAVTSQKLTKKGKWAILVTYRKAILSSTVTVR